MNKNVPQPILALPPTLPAIFVARKNRFIAEVELEGGRRVTAHLPNTGRLPELLVGGRHSRVRAAAPGAERSTGYTLSMIESPAADDRWISLETPLANRLFEALVEKKLVPGLEAEKVVRAEAPHGGSRFDFLLADGNGKERLVEVKSVNLFLNGEARFPDAPTTRGTKHLRELTEYVRNKGRATIAFVLMGGEARLFRPQHETDPEFAAALTDAKAAGVSLVALATRIRPKSAELEGVIPIELGTASK